jgi:hypothetical protein
LALQRSFERSVSRAEEFLLEHFCTVAPISAVHVFSEPPVITTTGIGGAMKIEIEIEDDLLDGRLE